MTQSQLDSAVADATGESLRTIHGRGFSIMIVDSEEPEPEDLALILDCPFCGHRVRYPGLAGDGTATLAECLRCDVYFDFAPGEVYASAASEKVHEDAA